MFNGPSAKDDEEHFFAGTIPEYFWHLCAHGHHVRCSDVAPGATTQWKNDHGI